MAAIGTLCAPQYLSGPNTENLNNQTPGENVGRQFPPLRHAQARGTGIQHSLIPGLA